MIFDVGWQDELIHTCHSGVLNTLQSKASAGHFGKYKKYTGAIQIKTLYFVVDKICIWSKSTKIIIKITGQDKTLSSLQHRFWMPLMKECVMMYIKYCDLINATTPDD